MHLECYHQEGEMSGMGWAFRLFEALAATRRALSLGMARHGAREFEVVYVVIAEQMTPDWNGEDPF